MSQIPNLQKKPRGPYRPRNQTEAEGKALKTKRNMYAIAAWKCPERRKGPIRGTGMFFSTALLNKCRTEAHHPSYTCTPRLTNEQVNSMSAEEF